MFHKMKLKPYLLSAFCVMILLAGIITALGIIGLINTSNNTDALVNQVLNAESAVKTCRIETNVAARDLREMLLTNDTARIAELKENINSSMESITEQIAVFKKPTAHPMAWPISMMPLSSWRATGTMCSGVAALFAEMESMAQYQTLPGWFVATASSVLASNLGSHSVSSSGFGYVSSMKRMVYPPTMTRPCSRETR